MYSSHLHIPGFSHLFSFERRNGKLISKHFLNLSGFKNSPKIRINNDKNNDLVFIFPSILVYIFSLTKKEVKTKEIFL